MPSSHFRHINSLYSNMLLKGESSIFVLQKTKKKKQAANQASSKIKKATSETSKKLSAVGRFLASKENKGKILDMRAVLK